MHTGLRRRDALKVLGGGVALLGCAPGQAPPPSSAPGASPSAQPQSKPAARPKRILVLGGTGFVGPPIVRSAVERGHTVTLFNRGKTNPGLFPDVETILGDRVTEIDRLAGRDWDAVVDTWARGPILVGNAAQLLKDHVGQYLFISTISVYKLGREAIDESSPLIPPPPGLDPRHVERIDETNYGPLKVMAEQAAEAAMPGRTTSVRAGVIAGPGDPSDRFTYWPLRFARGGEAIAPGSRDDRMQFIDVRDLGAWVVRTLEDRTFGIYNAVGPDHPELGTVLDTVNAAVGAAARLTWIDSAWLEKHQAGGWGDFPLAVPSGADDSGFGRVSAARAISRGLAFRPVAETAKDALAWWNAQPADKRAPKPPGLAPDREAELLHRWHAEKG